MRRLTVAVLALGCLALLAGTAYVSMPVALHAQPVFGDPVACPIDTSCPGGVQKVRVCHIAEGKAPVDLCVNASAFAPHFQDPPDEGHSKDYCLTDTVKICVDPGDPK